MRPALRTLIFVLLFCVSVQNVQAQTNTPIVVNDLGDFGGGGCVSICTLRSAIEVANNQLGPDTIVFAPALSGTLSPEGPYPALIDTVIIDATTSPNYVGAPLIVVEGSATAPGPSGFTFLSGSDGSVLRGFAIINFSGGSGVFVDGASNIAIQANYIGTDSSFLPLFPNLMGVRVAGTAANVLIGGPAPADRNIIAGNTNVGVQVEDTLGTAIVNNYIGVAADGSSPISNRHGIIATNAIGLIIGGTAPGAGNLISGNADFGVVVTGPPAGQTGATMQGNRIGTDAAGSAALPNGVGVFLKDAFGTFVGGPAPEARNQISGNAAAGLEIEGGTGNVVSGNYIGTDGGGTSALPNTIGIFLDNSSGNTIGGVPASVPGGGNLISGNQNGLVMFCSTPINTSNSITRNFIGSTFDGQASLPNVFGGIRIENCGANVIGGSQSESNLITGPVTPTLNSPMGPNLPVGAPPVPALIEIVTANGNQLFSNLIGTNISGTSNLDTGAVGVLLRGATNSAVGGSAGGNIIGGRDIGIVVTGGNLAGQSAVGNRIESNVIGAAASGLSPIPNSVGIIVSSTGFSAVDNPVLGTFIGGASSGNVISGNFTSGIDIRGDQVADVDIFGNRIGTDSTGTQGIPNAGDGIINTSPSAAVRVGSVAVPNTIAFNIGSGIVVEAGKLAATGNRIFSNSGLGIDLRDTNVVNDDPFDVNLNDALDADAGPNELQNYPEFSVRRVNGGVEVDGRLVSEPSQAYSLEFFLNEDVDQSGYGEGATSIGIINVTTGADGVAEFETTLTLAAALTETQSISATATDAEGRTSEFSISNTAESVFNPGERITTPPAVAVEDDDVVFTLKLFELPPNFRLRGALRNGLLARPRGRGKPSIQYVVTVMDTATNGVLRRKTKRNVVTVKNLPPGTYSASYKVRVKQDDRILQRSRQSPSTTFTVN